MKSIHRYAAALALAVVLSPAARAATVSYAPPAGMLPAGHYHGLIYSAILPSGRLVVPAGTSVVTGINAQGLALTPDGKYAIVSNDDGSRTAAAASSTVDPGASGGYSLAVVDAASMKVVTRYRAAGESFFAGVVALRDPLDAQRTLVLASGGASNAVYAFTLDGMGTLTPDAHHVIAIPGPADRGYADRGRSFPAALTLSRDGRNAFVVNASGNTVAEIDTATRRLLGLPQSVGYFPCGLAVAGSRLIVANEGLMRYGLLPARETVPSFAPPPADLQRASSLSLVSIAAAGFAGDTTSVPMDPAPDGLRVAGGAHPSAIVANAAGDVAFVAMSNVDRIASVQLGGVPHVAGGTELRLFDRGPYGTQPSALALSRDGSRLYVALTGLNAIAVVDARDPLHLHRLGLIPTGWAPSAIALGADDRTLFIVNRKGFGYDANAIWSTLQRVDLGDVRLSDATRAALAATRNVLAFAPSFPPAIRDVVLIVAGSATFDAALGDLGPPAGDPALVRSGAALTPNLHALARRYGVAGNLFADNVNAAAAHQVLAAGTATSFTERMAGVQIGRNPIGFAGQDPEDEPRLGTIFNALARRDITYRDYGDFLGVSGYADDSAPGLAAVYSQDVPAAAALAGHVDLAYPAGNPNVPDTGRAAEFVRDYNALILAHRAPRFAYVWLPSGGGAADTDRALGAIVDDVSHEPAWHTTAVFIVPADAGAGSDHVDPSRSFAIVISPFAKRRYVGMRHLSTASIVKTESEIFGLPPVSLGDLLAEDMSDFFTSVPDRSPYTAVSVAP